MWDPNLYHQTLRFAAQAHDGQLLPGTRLPYLVHVVNVCMETLHGMLKTGEGDINFAMQCALLHDTLEDTDVTFEELEARFGLRVAEGVLALTKNEHLPREGRMRDSLKRILQQPPEMRIVKMADRLTNMQQPPAHWSREKCRLYKEEALFILDILKGVNTYIEERLEAKIREYPDCIDRRVGAAPSSEPSEQ